MQRGGDHSSDYGTFPGSKKKITERFRNCRAWGLSEDDYGTFPGSKKKNPKPKEKKPKKEDSDDEAPLLKSAVTASEGDHSFFFCEQKIILINNYK